MCRADFRTPQTLIECKTDVTTKGINKALGQCCICKAVAGVSMATNRAYFQVGFNTL
jgi:hypothetical protein